MLRVKARLLKAVAGAEAGEIETILVNSLETAGPNKRVAEARARFVTGRVSGNGGHYHGRMVLPRPLTHPQEREHQRHRNAARRSSG